MTASKTPESHALLPLAHEALRAFVPGFEEAVKRVAKVARDTFGEDATVFGPRLVDVPGARDFVEGYSVSLLRDGWDAESARAEGDFLGHHFCYAVNFELHRRKVFWVDESLAWMLSHTNLDIEGRAFKLPFTSFAIVFQDPSTLALLQGVLAHDVDCLISDQPPRVLTVYVMRGPGSSQAQEIEVTFLADARTGKWPYILGRTLFIKPDDDLETILDSRAPDINAAALDASLRSPELKRMVQLVINAILYATSASDTWPVVQSPAKAVEMKARGLGAKRQKRAETRAAELRKAHSSESVFFLPGKIPISRLRQLRAVERSEGGGELFARFMVRGHWRHPPATWTDQHLRFIEPYWKGPDMATILEREYRMKL
jgi:hypothetical protein